MLNNSSNLLMLVDALSKYSGVIELKIGRPVKSDRLIVDDSFDVALYVVVKNAVASQGYLNHPIYIEAVNIAKPIAQKMLVYDFFHKE